MLTLYRELGHFYGLTQCHSMNLDYHYLRIDTSLCLSKTIQSIDAYASSYM